MMIYANVQDTIDPEEFKLRAGKAARAVAAQAERDMRAYIPSKRVAENGRVDGRKIVWSHPLAPVMFQGFVQVDPKFGIGGFLTKDGWRSRPGVDKIHSNRQFHFLTGGPRWTYRAKEQNLEAWRKLARRILLNGK